MMYPYVGEIVFVIGVNKLGGSEILGVPAMIIGVLLPHCKCHCEFLKQGIENGLFINFIETH